jgi:hypothetical protein
MMTPTNKPIYPLLRNVAAANSGPAPVPPKDPGCTILDHCDQCGRRLARPHVSNTRAYCGDCCPTCARNGFSR